MTGEVQKTTWADQFINAARNFSANDPRPDCSSITDSELGSAITFRRLRSNVINYSFKSPFTLSNLLSYPNLLQQFHYQFLKGESDFVEANKKLTRFIFAELEKVSEGRMKFVENDYASEKIFINFIQSLWQTGNLTTIGQTVRLHSVSGRVSDSAIWMAETGKFFITLPSMAHEILHTLGFDHLHEFPILQNKLRNTPEGMFCSQMAYPRIIQTPISKCSTNCTISIWNQTVTVDSLLLFGQLDARLLDLAYSQGVFKPNMDAMHQSTILGIFLGIRICVYYKALSKLFRSISQRMNTSNFNEKFNALAKDLSFVLAFAATTVIEKEILVGLTLLALVKFLKHVNIQKSVPPGSIQDLVNTMLINLVIVLMGEPHPLLLIPRLFFSLFIVTGMGVFSITNNFDKTGKIEPEENVAIEEPTAIVVDEFPRRKVISYLFTEKVKNDEVLIQDESLQTTFKTSLANVG